MPKKQKTFESAYRQLEQLVENFESGKFGLDESLKKYEEGLKIVVDLQRHLSHIGNKVQEIKKKFIGEAGEDKE